MKNLEFEPYFKKHVRDAFFPMAMMLDFWEKEISNKDTVEIDIVAINDTRADWNGDITLSLTDEQSVTKFSESKITEIPRSGSAKKKFFAPLAHPEGNYQLIAELVFYGDTVTSSREFRIIE